MKTVYDQLREWMPRFDPQGPACSVLTASTAYSGTAGYLTNHVWSDDMKALKVLDADEASHTIWAERI